MKTLYSFDFDDTLFHTPVPETGKEIWENKTGSKYPHIGWWSKIETLDIDIFDIPKNEWVHEHYRNLNESDYVIMATGRLNRVVGMRDSVNRILEKHDLKFDEIHLNYGKDTYLYKIELFERLIKETECDKFVMFDDRQEHLEKFIKWGELQDCEVVIMDALNKKRL